MLKNAVYIVELTKSAFAPSMSQEREMSQQLSDFHTCWLIQNMRLAEMSDTQQYCKKHRFFVKSL